MRAESCSELKSIVRITISSIAFTPATLVIKVELNFKVEKEAHFLKAKTLHYLFMLLLCGPNWIFLIHVYHVCIISYVQPTPSQFSMSYPCLTSPFVCTVRRGVSACSSPLCLCLVFPPTSTLIASFHSFSSHLFIPLFIFSISCSFPLTLTATPLPPSHPYILFHTPSFLSSTQ